MRGCGRMAGLRDGSLSSRGKMLRLHASSCMPVCFWFGVLSAFSLAWLPLVYHACCRLVRASHPSRNQLMATVSAAKHREQGSCKSSNDNTCHC